MTAFRLILTLILVAIVAYTVPVVANHGIDLLPVFFGDIARMGWPGQFNVDFLGFLVLSGLWLAWRHRFSAGGIALGVLGFFGGAPVLTAYLLVVSYRADGDWAVIMLGPGRAGAAPAEPRSGP
jgi:hypothetical protein